MEATVRPAPAAARVSKVPRNAAAPLQTGRLRTPTSVAVRWRPALCGRFAPLPLRWGLTLDAYCNGCRTRIVRGPESRIGGERAKVVPPGGSGRPARVVPPQVRLDHRGVAPHLVGPALGDHAAAVHDDHAVGDRHRQVELVLHQGGLPAPRPWAPAGRPGAAGTRSAAGGTARKVEWIPTSVATSSVEPHDDDGHQAVDDDPQLGMNRSSSRVADECGRRAAAAGGLVGPGVPAWRTARPHRGGTPPSTSSSP